MTLFAFILSIFVTIQPSSTFVCDGEVLTATIRNNLNGDFALVTDLNSIDEGSFVVLDWSDVSLMLPISFQAGEISFTDKKWLWSYKDKDMGLHVNTPRLAQRLPNGVIKEHTCNSYNESEPDRV